MNQFFTNLGNILRNYSPIQRILMVVVFLAMISSSIALVFWANRPEYQLLYSDLEPSNASKIVSELQGMKIPYTIQDNGHSVLVPADNVADLRLRFVDMGLAGQPVNGYEIFDDSKIGMTTFMQQLNMRRALEGELTKTINQFPGIKHSRVHIVLPENQLFEQENNGSASVVLYLNPGHSLGREQVKGIAALVANSVQGIEPEKVVVVDSEGRMLTEANGSESNFAANSQWEMRHAIEMKLQQKVCNLLEGVVGPQNAIVQISADLNFEKIERTSEIYDPENVAIISEERHSGSTRDQDSLNSTNQIQENEDVITNYEINKTVEHYVGNSGTVNRLTVAVLVNGSYKAATDENGEEIQEYVARSKQELSQLEALVKSAVGYDSERGDLVEVRNLPFENPGIEDDLEYFKSADKQAMWASVIDKGILGLGLLIAFFFVRTLLKSASQTLQFSFGPNAQPLEGGNEKQDQLEESEPVPELPDNTYLNKLSPEAQARLKAKGLMTEEVIKHAQENPEDSAKLIRSWLTRPVLESEE
ncbi:MAG: flagellar M-ring protein FliF [FCB group bacterium]|nr:flagellar M-ring protein FliF [FCB group bacterium]